MYTKAMYAGVDIGGTKTLVAVLSNDGKIVEETRLPTPKLYDEFLEQVAQARKAFKHQDYLAVGVGMPASRIDRKHGRGLDFGNLPWVNVPVQHDLERIFDCPLVLENDAKMAALSEALLLAKQFSRVLYVTVSTGIGLGLVVDGKIDSNVGDTGGATMLLEHHGKYVPWESYASGHAIVERYGKRAEDIHDATTWRAISRDLATGFIELIAIMQPEVIVIGGSVGNYFERYGDILAAEIKRYNMPHTVLPVLRQAQRPDQAVIFGCFDLAKQRYGHAASTR